MLKDSFYVPKKYFSKMHSENNEGKKFTHKQLKLAISFAQFSTGVQQVQPAGHF